jgi:hypothetical protein
LHNQEGEAIRGSEMKTLYEKFCYFNGYLEKKLDDQENLKVAEGEGFQVGGEVKRLDGVLQFYKILGEDKSWFMFLRVEVVVTSQRILCSVL